MKTAWLLGQNISQSFSPMIFSTLSKLTAMPFAYEIKDLSHSQFEELGRTGFGRFSDAWIGCNVTIPYKEKILLFCQSKSELAQQVGAANTVVYNSEWLHAENTDVFGIIQSLNSCPLHGRSVLILGAGGAARAAIMACIMSGASHVRIQNRSEWRVKNIASDFSKQNYANVSVDAYVPGELRFNLLVHARPYDQANIPAQDDLFRQIWRDLNQGATVFDMVYRPLRTRLLIQAENSENPIVRGLDMLIWQALKAWDLWTSQTRSSDQDLKAKIEKVLLQNFGAETL